MNGFDPSGSTSVALVSLLIGTVIQALVTLRRMDEVPLAQSGVTVYELMGEVSALHPIHRWRHRRTLKQALKESPAETRAYSLLRWTVWSWSVLIVGSLFALIGHFLGR